MSANCLRCGKPGYVNTAQLPVLACDHCDTKLTVQKLDGSNYFYVCGGCKKNWQLSEVVPDWSELFEYAGLAAHGDEADGG